MIFKDDNLRSDCKIYQSVNQGKAFIVDNEVFWKANGQPIDVEYRVRPQI
ncbi:MAG: hypothetical protein GX974_00890 [Clostridiales bacterium]|nr:hypothetical protein [Clostridiales bacterium]